MCKWLCTRFFRFDPLSKTFSNRCLYYENAQRISVDKRPKRIKIYVFSNKYALVAAFTLETDYPCETGYQWIIRVRQVIRPNLKEEQA